MSEASTTTADPTPPADVPRRRRWQIGLRTSLLLVAAVAVWLTYGLNKQRNTHLATRIAVMRPLARELSVDDAGKVAVVKLEELWYDENRWDLYLPAGSYRLCLATRGIEQNGLIPAMKTARLGAGRHLLSLELTRDGPVGRVTAAWDGVGRLSAEEPEAWYPKDGSMGGGEFSRSTQLDARQPVVLFRRIFLRRDDKGMTATPQGPADGLMLWIEPESDSTARP